YYEDATFELWGLPIIYLPYFSTPDPSVKKKTGFLAPRYYVRSQLGFGVGTPFFWNLAPNYDLTLTPNFFTKQGFLGEIEWRHKIFNGSYDLRLAGIFQNDAAAFTPFPYGPGDKRFRGSIESDGLFHLSPNWQFGWNIALQTDRWFFQQYSF